MPPRGPSGLQPDFNAATPLVSTTVVESIVRGWRPRPSENLVGRIRPPGLSGSSAVGVEVGLLRRTHAAIRSPLRPKALRRAGG